jgi:hypothetical protein
MSYWALVLLAVSAGALFGSAPLAWPWRRSHPVRGTIGFVLLTVGCVVLVGARLLGWDQGSVERGGILATVGLFVLVAVWLAPNQSAWTRWIYVLAYGWLIYHLYSRYLG